MPAALGSGAGGPAPACRASGAQPTPGYTRGHRGGRRASE
eukprot:CAMPEP_0179316452 /NCGR_PEP_ID=MMETSP0797-20121207/55686_1 /TAXON_ID=47934 /ORGANISM="Dinophysis acuminata, Strain DAEP01" /LENGTH=39 /DNA_ID= /DNA_START= /DNA_END= /DNA_ORIENTATION=